MHFEVAGLSGNDFNQSLVPRLVAEAGVRELAVYNGHSGIDALIEKHDGPRLTAVTYQLDDIHHRNDAELTP